MLKRTVRQITRHIMGLPPSEIFGDDRRLKSMWDEFCVEMQLDASINRSAFECQMDQFVSGHMQNMKPLDLWALYFVADGDPPERWVSVSTQRPDPEPIVRHVGAEVLRMAEAWTNQRIRSYVEDHTYSTS